jgi:hypothetical protein
MYLRDQGPFQTPNITGLNWYGCLDIWELTEIKYMG